MYVGEQRPERDSGRSTLFDRNVGNSAAILYMQHPYVIHVPCSADYEQDWQTIDIRLVDPYSADWM